MSPVDSRPAQLRVKICGLTNESDARAAIAAGADALGFNFWPGSKRFIEPGASGEWIARLPAGPTRVAVAVDPEFATALAWLESPGIDALQLHGGETPDFCRELLSRGHRIIKAIRIQSADSVASAATYPPEVPLLLDAWVDDCPGGTGQPANWELAAEMVRHFSERRVILAGGLNSENVTAAVERVRPFGVDVASGVETPGFARSKDLSRLQEFFSTLAGAGFRSEPAAEGAAKGLI